jgi:hypothetical protein
MIAIRQLFIGGGLFLSALLAFSGCRDIVFSDEPGLRLEFSSDTILFDTVFTTVGSITLPLKVYNRNDVAVEIQRIGLAGGSASAFRMNVDGYPGPEVEGLPLLAGDSLWVFIEVTVDPTDQFSPFVIEDAIEVELNGGIQEVTVAAWGRNAYFHGGLERVEALPCNAIWTPDLAHVVYGVAVVDEDCTLEILPGTEVYFHARSGIWINQGTLTADGTSLNPILFRGDRLEDGYADLPGQWGIQVDFDYETDYGVESFTIARGGLWFYGSKGSLVDHAVIEGGTIGIQVDTVGSATSPALLLTNTRIRNMTATGLLAQGGVIDGYNNLITDCGQVCAAFTIGGVYRMEHCTFANYWSEGVRQAPAVFVNDWYEAANGQLVQRSLEGSSFRNCIIWGNSAGLTDFDELVSDVINVPSLPLFQSCAVDVQNEDFPYDLLGDCTTDEEPPFFSEFDRDFHLNSNSSMWEGGGGSGLFFIPTDLDGLPRNVGVADKGCFERQ